MEQLINALLILIDRISAPVCTGIMAIILYRLQKMDQKRDTAREENKEREKQKREESIRRETAKNEKDERERIELMDIVKENRDMLSLINDSSKSTMRYMLQRRHAEYKTQGCITSIQLDEFNLDYETYKAQGGNGTAEKWHKEVNALPIDDTYVPKNIYLEMLKNNKG